MQTLDSLKTAKAEDRALAVQTLALPMGSGVAAARLA
jgi:hypothetical protein